MSKLRFDVVQDAFKKKAVAIDVPETRPSEYFGELVFNRDKMRKYLDVRTFNALVNCVDNGASLDRETADHVHRLFYQPEHLCPNPDILC